MNPRGKLFYAVMCLAGVVLALTGIGTFALGQPPMTHLVLMAHVAAAPVFALGLAAVALTWAGPCIRGANSGLGAAAKALFWVMLLCGLVVILTGIVPMTPLFGAGGQRILYLTHRYSGLVLTGAILLHLVAMSRRAPSQT
jgi:cytochrome b subunit of formate dehydrogenase